MSYTLKYRILSTEELAALEEEFKQFLIVHGVFGEEWKKMNEENPDEAIELVEIFSDTVLEKVYSGINYLEFRTKDLLILLAYSEDKIEQIRIQAKGSTEIDLLNWQGFTAAMNSLEKLDAFYGKKVLLSLRNESIHEYVNQGFTPADKSFWEQMKSFIAPN